MIENLVEINMPENFVWVQWVTRVVLIITWLVAMIVAAHSKRMMLFTAIPILTPFAIIYMLIKRISGAIYPASLLGLAALCFYGGTNVVVEADKLKLRKELSEFWTNNTRFSTAAKNLPESSEDNIWEHPYLKTIALAAGTNSIATEARQQLDQKYGNMRIGKPKLEFEYELTLPEDDLKQASALTPFRSLHRAAIALKEKEDSKPSITNLPASVEDSVEILGSFFKSVEPSCNDLQEAVSRPVDEFPYQWKEGLNMLLPNLSQIKAFTELFSLRSIYQLTRKEPKLGFDDALFAFRLGHVSESNITISRLVQIANTLKALETLVAAETFHSWSNEQLFAIHQTISEIKPLDWLPNMVRSEVDGTSYLFGPMLDMRSSEIHRVIDSLGKNGNYEGYHPTLRTAIWDYATGNWSRAMVSKNWRLYLGTATAMIEDLELFKQEAQYKPWSELSFHWDVNRIKNTCIFVGMFFGSFVDLPDRFVKTAVLLEMGKISIELEIFRNDKGAYPQNLDDFPLIFTGSSLLDPMTGEPFEYKTTDAGGYVLSSVGLQGSEDYVGNKTRSTKGLTGNIHWIIDESNKNVSQFSMHVQD